jgi:hypothetical protein
MKFLANERYSLAIGLALALLVTCMVYLPGLEGGFVFDDLPNIVSNTELHVTTTAWQDWSAAAFSSPSSSLHRPLAMLTFAANHYFTGLDPVPMKLTNILVHLANLLLAFGLIRHLLRLAAANDAPGLVAAQEQGRTGYAALFTAAAWALHPINLMAVLFIVQRMESLCHTFVFAGLWCYLEGRRRQLVGEPGWTWVLGGLAGFSVLGLLVKESAVLLPLYAACVELCVLRLRAAKPSTTRTLQWLFLLGLALPALAALLWLGGLAIAPGAFGSRDYNLWERMLTEGRVVLDYLRWHLVPDLGHLSLYHDDYVPSRGWLSPPSTLLSLLCLALVLGLALKVRARRPLFTLGVLWFFSAQALTATVIPLELMFEHRNYFASLGICLALADLLLIAPTAGARSRAGVILACVFTCFLATTTWLRSKEWDNPYRFAVTEAAKHPQSPRATYAVARLLCEMSGYRSDSPWLSKAIEELERARRVPRANVQPAQALLIIASRTGRPMRDEWWLDAEHKLRSQPITWQETGALASMERCQELKLCHFPRERMLALFAAALSHGDHAEVYNIYGSYALNVLDDPDLCLRLWLESVKLVPSEPQYRINLIRLLVAMRADEAAQRQIAALRALGRVGQYEKPALEMEALMRTRQDPRTPAER